MDDPDAKRVRLDHNQSGHPLSAPVARTHSYQPLAGPSSVPPGGQHPQQQQHHPPPPPPPPHLQQHAQHHHGQPLPPPSPFALQHGGQQQQQQSPFREPLPDPRGLPAYHQPLPTSQPGPIDGPQSYGPVSHHSSRSFSSESGTPRPSSAATPVKPEHRGPPPAAQEHHPHMEHGVHPSVYPPPPLDSHSSNPMQNGLPFHPSSDQYSVGQVSSHHSYPPTPVSGFPPSGGFSGPTNYGSLGARRKQVRAQQACNNCRQRKQKCDESRPCGYCKQENLDCEYREVPPPKTDRTMLEILKKMDDYQGHTQEQIGQTQDRLADLQNQMRQLVNYFMNQQSQLSPGLPQLSPGMPPPSLKTDPSTPAQRNASFTTQAASSESLETVETVVASSAPDFAEDALGGHVTGAHHLRKWKSIREFFAQAGVDDEEYVQHEEERQGPLKLYGPGSLRDDNFLGDYGVASPPHSNPMEPMSAHTPPDGSRPVRSVGFPGSNNSASNSEFGGLNADGSLKLDASVVRRLHDSYLEHMWVIHPFLDAQVLKRMINDFVAAYSPGTARSPKWAVPGIPNSESYGGLPAKRKRPGGPGDDHSSPSSPGMPPYQPPPKRPDFDRTVENAIVLLVLALGNILEHDEFLLEDNGPPQHRYTSAGSNAPNPNYNFIKPSPPQSYSSVAYSSAPSPNFGPSRTRAESRGSSVERPAGEYNLDGNRKVHIRHTERIPGIAYFAVATDLLGNNMTGNDIPHAQAFLLAGLYLGQIGRVLDSWNWIYAACRVIVMMYKSRYMQMIKDEEEAHAEATKGQEPQLPASFSDRLQTFATLYWSALQLDGDIRAELDRLPPEILSAYTDSVPWPQRTMGVTTHPNAEHISWIETQSGRNFDVSRVLIYFNAQFSIRKLLNRAHMSLYNIKENLKWDKNAPKVRWASADAPMQWDALQGWRTFLPDMLKWDENEPAASDINAARLRGKYYGAAYIITRPYLEYAIHKMLPRDLEDFAADDGPEDSAWLGVEDALPKLPKEAITKREWEDSVIKACKRCIASAIKSTLAFDGLNPHHGGMFRRPRVTNIHGTAAAQFSNMLVLAATYKSWLWPLVPPQKFFQLLDRTIIFLRRLTPLSTVFGINLRILELVKQECVMLREKREGEAYGAGGMGTPQTFTPQPRPGRVSSLSTGMGTSSAHSSFSSNL